MGCFRFLFDGGVPLAKKRTLTRPTKRHGPTPLQDSAATLTVQNPHAAGIDVHSDLHVVCVGPGAVREFDASTADLRDIVTYLRDHGVTTVAMESTSVYWIPLFELLETQGFAVYLVEPAQLKHCSGRPKTDVLDAQWIQRLHTYGLLRGSFRPPEDLLKLRAYGRQRQMLLRLAGMHAQHMQKALEQMNLKLTEVLSDITGITGMAIITAILAGQRDPKELAKLRHPHCAKAESEIARALEGTWRDEHLFALQQAQELYRFYQEKGYECDQRLAAELPRLPDRAGEKESPPRSRSHAKNRPQFEATELLFHALGVDLTRIPGIDVSTALVVLAEMGVDVSRFPTEKPSGSAARERSRQPPTSWRC